MNILAFVLFMWTTFVRATTTDQPASTASYLSTEVSSTEAMTYTTKTTMTTEVTFPVSTTPNYETTSNVLNNITLATTEGKSTTDLTTSDGGFVDTTHKVTTNAQTTTTGLVTTASTGSVSTASTGSLTPASTGSVTTSTGLVTSASTGSVTTASNGSLTPASTGSVTTSTGSLTSASTGVATATSRIISTTPTTKLITTPSLTTTTKSKHDPCGGNPCRNDSASFCSVASTSYQCLCLPGYTRNTTTSKCQRVLQFGGALVTTTPSSRRRKKRAVDATTSEDVHKILDKIFSEDVSGYLDVTVADAPEKGANGVESWGYVVLCEYESSADEKQVNAAMTNYLTDKCPDTSCNIPVNGKSISVVKDETIAAAGTDTEVVCEKQPCSSSSTTCIVTSGVPACQCKTDYRNVYGSLVACTGIVCSQDSQCNHGTCDPGANLNLGECKCTTLYKGQKCDNPWFLVFVIVISLLGFIILAAVTFTITRRLRSKRRGTKKIVMTSLYDPKPLDVPDLSLRARAPSDVMFSNESFAP